VESTAFHWNPVVVRKVLLLRMMGRNVLEGGRLILEVTEDDGRCGSAMDEDDGSGGSMWMVLEDNRRDILQLHFWRAGRAHVYQRTDTSAPAN